MTPITARPARQADPTREVMQAAKSTLLREVGRGSVSPLASRPRRPRLLREAEVTVPFAFPNRYRIRERERGVTLTCAEAPTVAICIERGFTVGASAARRYPPGAIFLDGAAQGAPFVDTKRAVYNLDHHEGCVRPFTLATCEQAMVLVRGGLGLRKREWTVFANDADLDTVLAIWVLLNHMRLGDSDPALRTRIMPLLRLQGAIDAHGLEMQDFAALPPDLFEATRVQMDRVRRPELDLKARGLWDTIDLLEYTADRLRAIDRLVYTPTHFADVEEIEEIQRVEIGDGSVAVVCESEAGIYEVEKQLRRLHGKRLGLIVLRKNATTYSLRQVDSSLPATLDAVYTHLNLVDPGTPGNRSSNRWGGSAEIGGSPRHTGTRLAPGEIARVCQLVYRRPSFARRAWRISQAVAAATAATLAFLPVAGSLAATTASWLPSAVDPVAGFAGILVSLAGALALATARRTPGLFGMRRPAGWDWALTLPVALLGALAGGVWAPALSGAGSVALAILVVPAACELLFRGLVHGSLAQGLPCPVGAGGWRPSWAVLGSAALYASWMMGLHLLAPSALASPLASDLSLATQLLGALLVGVTAGVARERSESVVAPIVIHALCAVALAAAILA